LAPKEKRKGPKMRDSNLWYSKDGRGIPYEDLENNHLRNIIKMLWRNKSYSHAELLQILDVDDPTLFSEVSDEKMFFSVERNYSLMLEAKRRGLPLPATIWDAFKMVDV